MVIKNNKGQVVFVSFMFAITIIVLALAWAFPIRQAVDNARGDTVKENRTYEVWNETSFSADTLTGEIEQVGMNCSSSTISSWDKAGCLVSDLTIFYFIGGLIAIVGIVIGAKIVFT